MIQYWWKDLFDRNNNWQGLEPTLKSSQRTDVAMEMLSGRYGRMALQVSGETLFWASMLKDHSGVWLVFNADHSACQTLLPAVTSEDIEGIKSKGERAWTGEWCRYFFPAINECASASSVSSPMADKADGGQIFITEIIRTACSCK